MFVDHVVVVTGAGSGIGARIAGRFAEEGALVVVADISLERAHEVCERIRGQGARAEPAFVDVTENDSVLAFAAQLERDHGGVDVLVNNAAIATELGFEHLTEAQWDGDIAVTLKGTFLVTRALVPLLQSRTGAIVNIGSVNGTQAIGNDAYSAAKAGLVALTRNVAFGLGPRGIRCNVVMPGTVKTAAWDARLAKDPEVLARLSRHYPLRRIGTPDDVAAAVLFLASAQAGWITGTALAVDGGLSCGNVALSAEVFRADLLSDD